MRIGIDAGGTFTDFVVLDRGVIRTFKIRSNRKAPAQVILRGIQEASGEKAAEVVHGSTVATNALLERKGAKTALVTTAGFEDLVAIGRQNRAELYNLTPTPRLPLVEPENCFGVPERTLFDGSIVREPDMEGIAKAVAGIARNGAGSVAVCCLHSYQEPANEKAIAEALRAALGDGVYICRSAEVSPEFREYERASTTVINAYVGPLMDAYLGELETAAKGSFWILQSNGGYMTAAQARRHAVRTVLSGPAGGVIAATELARRSGFKRILGFDMGGTSTDVSLCDGEPRLTTESTIDHFPVRVPMLDIHTVGAGGGSIARVDVGGLLRVGPESAGSDPGPACYGTGAEPTVTDAQVVLGRIAANQFLGGAMAIDEARAAEAVARVAEPLGLPLVDAAAGILRVANANMERAIRAVSIERGHDPRDFALVAFGGAGGLHACELAAELGMRAVIVPRYAEALSALGMLLADCVRDYSAAALGREDFEERYRVLEAQAREELGERAELQRAADLRYAGQSYELTVTWRSRAKAVEEFHREHQRSYGYSSLARAVEVVTLRLRARIATKQPAITPLDADSKPPQTRRVFVEQRWRDIPVYTRAQLAGMKPTPGPAIVIDYGATTLAPPGWILRVDRVGNLICRME